MGCDIHLGVEILAGGAWENFRRPVPTHPYATIPSMSDITSWDWYTGRNYTLFSALADVRNDTAGTATYIQPIAAPRGLPRDADPDTIRFAEPFPKWLDRIACSPARDESTPDNVADGEHSASWFLLSEILDWAGWEKLYEDEGVVTSDGFRDWKEQGSPQGWSRAVGSGGLSVETNEGMRQSLKYATHYVALHTGLTSLGRGNYTVVEYEAPFDYAGTRTVEPQRYESVVDTQGFAVFESGGSPPLRAEVHTSGGWIVTPTRMAQILESKTLQASYDLSSLYTVVRWKFKLGDRCQHFLQAMNELRDVAHEKGLSPKDVRLVFNFDC